MMKCGVSLLKNGSELLLSLAACESSADPPRAASDCVICHPIQVEQFSAGRHALAWASMNAMPTTHFLPMALTEGMKGYGGCHRIGSKTKTIKAEGGMFGLSSCDVCHTAPFSPSRRRESRRPARPATWGSTTPSGRCTPHRSTGSGTC